MDILNELLDIIADARDIIADIKPTYEIVKGETDEIKYGEYVIFNCKCGSKINYKNRMKHFSTKKHLRYIKR